MRLTPAEVAMVERLRREAEGVFTVVMQQGQVRQVAKRAKGVDASQTNLISFQQGEQAGSLMASVSFITTQ